MIPLSFSQIIDAAFRFQTHPLGLQKGNYFKDYHAYTKD